MSDKIRVVELFAGVGGFRIGLEGWNGMSATSGYTKPINSSFQTIWSNQWEPSTKLQHASDLYRLRFGDDSHSNRDISLVDVKNIPDHDLLVGGFPCQDYSVARTLNHSGGLGGKKGVLWWDIHRILTKKGKQKPKYLLLENVDRLLKLPVTQRGRDFAVMLTSLSDLGYAVEWRVINAAEYGFPQRRRRVFFMGYHKSTEQYKNLIKQSNPLEWTHKNGAVAKAFPVKIEDGCKISKREFVGELVDISDKFNSETPKISPFNNSGVMINRTFYTAKVKPSISLNETTLGEVLQDESEISSEFYLTGDNALRWEYLKGAKKEERTNSRTGFTYNYTEGGMIFPDSLNKPSRTIITGEGGKSASRFKHVVEVNGKRRRLTPVELERLNMFPDNHTKGTSTDTKRAFFMGNALVIGIIEKIGKEIQKLEECKTPLDEK